MFFGTKELLERTTKLLGPIWSQGFGSTESGAVTTRLLATEVEGHPKRLDSVGRPGSPFLEVANCRFRNSRLTSARSLVHRMESFVSEAGPLLGSTQTRMVGADWATSLPATMTDICSFQGRLDGMINTGSYHAYPAEIEAALTSLPGITGAKVRGEDDPKWGQAVTAYVIADDLNRTSDELNTELRGKLASYKIPKNIKFVSSLPT